MKNVPCYDMDDYIRNYLIIKERYKNIMSDYNGTQLSINDMGAAYKNMKDNEITTSSVTIPANESYKKSYKYDEDQFLIELKKHIDKTYVTHYGGMIQPVEFIMSNSSTLDYLRGNVVKYIYRYGQKGGNNPDDLYKACHYLMMMLKYSKE